MYDSYIWFLNYLILPEFHSKVYEYKWVPESDGVILYLFIEFLESSVIIMTFDSTNVVC